MKKLIVILLVVLTSICGTVTNSFGVYSLPSARSITWSPGVSGGIPIYANGRNAVTDDGATGDGIADDTAEIQSCINNTAAGTACYLPAGTYKITSQLNIYAGKVLRGAGVTSKIISYGTTGDIIRMGTGSEGSLINISSGYTKDSTSLTFADAATISSIAIGDYIVVVQSNDTSLVEPVGNNGNCGWCGLNNTNTLAMNQIVRVTGKVDNVLTIHRPLYFTFQASLIPRIIEFGMITNAGIETLYIENDSSTLNLLSSNIGITKCAYCWVKDIESYNANRFHIRVSEAYGAEIRDSKFTYGHSYGGDHAYGVQIFVTNSDHLIENNIFYHLRHSMVLEGGGSGCVFGYNYSELMWDESEGSTNWLMSDMLTHGVHSYMNLFEGNIVNRITADFVWGSSSHNTYFRNYSDTQSNGAIYALRAFEIMKFNRYINVVGNVLGYAGTYTAYEDGQGTGDNTRAINTDDLIYSFGYSSDDDTTSDDQNPYDTVLRHGNYDYHNDSIVWNGGDDQTLPSSLYYGSKPSWYGDCTWPPIDPTTPTVNDIPAKLRYEGTTCTVTCPSKVTFTTEPSGGVISTDWATQPVVTIQDVSNNTCTDATNSVTLAITNNPSSGTLSCTTNPLSATSGVATFTGCDIDKSGTGYTITASASGLTSDTSAAFNITCTPSKVTFSTQPGGGVISNDWVQQPIVSVQNSSSVTCNEATNSVTLAINNNPGSGTLSCATNPLTASNGLASFSGCDINAVGTGYTLDATASGLTTATSSSFNINQPANSRQPVTRGAPPSRGQVGRAQVAR